MNNPLQAVLGFPRRAARYASRRVRGLIYRFRPKHSLNIGGGSSFYEPGWYNLEEVASKLNPRPFLLTPDCVFPPASASIQTVYTAHALEHLDTPTFLRVLAETRRVLRSGGRFIIKIPDFDRTLQCWKRGEQGFFADRAWNIDAAARTWKNRGVCDCIDHRAAMIFCGFWNAEYGHEFFGASPDNKSAYYGPPVVDAASLRSILAAGTPARIGAELRKAVMTKEKNYTFSHQNAWGRQELEEALNSAGFRVRSFDSDSVIAACADIPGIDWMRGQSLYCWAEKKP